MGKSGTAITSRKVLKFVIKNIVSRFWISHKIISNHGTQFESEDFTRFYNRNEIIKSFLSVAHHKAANKTTKTILKKQLDKAKWNLVEEPSLMLWAYRTAKIATGLTSFVLTYGCEVMLPIEIKVLSRQRIAYAFNPNQELKREYLDMINELGDETSIRTIEYQRRRSNIATSKWKKDHFKKKI